VPAGAPTAAKESAVPTVGLAGALAPTATKGGPTGGWGSAAAVAPATVPAGAPAVTTAPMARSREAEAVATA
jgi:hypothetical protein